ncbi:hypothetical protein [Actinomadura sp. BRA 177]|uniref:hypothetical protein n=1 Tax=Actinomadura sp. BRA 177 TaxID=2745202 RepID=UPI0020CD6413|nr:hypothetical protein [Actinomadura sp. BRA 177]
MIGTLHRWGVKSNLMYTAGIASVGLAFASWAASNRLEAAGLERADRWGIFIGEWAPTFFGMGIALRTEEMRDEVVMEASGQRGSIDEKVTTSPSAAMR